MRLLIVSLLFALNAVAQDKALFYTNHGQAIKLEVGTFYSNKIHDIKLSPDATFEFWSRPGTSCFLWREFKGTWKKDKDTFYFSDEYEISQDDVTATYDQNKRQSFRLYFRTDEGHRLHNKQIRITYIYDYDAKLKDVPGDFTFSAGNTLEIPFRNIPNYDKLASIQIDYQLNDSTERREYLTTNDAVNSRKRNIPNNISVVFVERPKTEMVYRITKGVIRDGKLFIVSTKKTVGHLKDYGEDLQFEDGYVLER